MIKKGLVEELKWRYLLHNIIPDTEKILDREMVTGYVGFDPTADSLHIGNLVPVMLLMHFQHFGHKPIVLVGGATGMVGDPSGKTKERQLLDRATIQQNLECQKKQLQRFLNFDGGKNTAEIVDNYDWFKNMNFLDFIRDVGKHISINYMLAKDSVKTRLKTGMSFTEFTYQLVQGYDFYYLYKTKNCKLQMGGSDQWGNIVTGTELIRRKAQGGAFALTAPLIKKADGSKFGKSEGENIWLDANKTSPYKFYQYWLNSTDEDAEKYIKIFTKLSKKDIDQLIEEHNQARHLRILQKRLAENITSRIHSPKDLHMAMEASNILFGKATTSSLNKLDERTFLSVFDGVPQYRLDKNLLNNGIDITTLLTEKTTVFPSKSDLRRLLKNNAIGINKEKIRDIGHVVSLHHLIADKYILVQKGKKNYFVLTFS